ncbi:MAG: class II fructose-bisphosphate aldolase [Armatimonadota bacterium]|nr:MAG: class II fructose-bisphosphate aldolase [Armatimonadota bacterium]
MSAERPAIRTARHLVSLASLLAHAREHRYAVGAFDFCNAETAQAIVAQGAALRAPALLMIGPWEMPLLGAEMVADIISWLASRTDVPVCLHLDHSSEIEPIRECIEAGFPSVMIDASHYEFEENVRRTREVVALAHAAGVFVEGELGAVGSVGDATVEGDRAASLTDPDEAAEFVKRTGVDALAVAIGNAHGIYRQHPALDFDRLRAIRHATDVPLVLHGGSGTPPEQLRQAIEIGVTKVNVASELSRAYLDAIQELQAAKAGKAWYAHALVEAKAAFGEVVARWMRELGSAGQAP